MVPVSGAAIIVATLVSVAVLYCDLDRVLEIYWIWDVIAVPSDFAIPILITTREGKAMIGGAVLLSGAPAHTIIVLCACANKARRILTIYEDHIVTLTIPVETLGRAEIVDIHV